MTDRNGEVYEDEWENDIRKHLPEKLKFEKSSILFDPKATSTDIIFQNEYTIQQFLKGNEEIKQAYGDKRFVLHMNGQYSLTSMEMLESENKPNVYGLTINYHCNYTRNRVINKNLKKATFSNGFSCIIITDDLQNDSFWVDNSVPKVFNLEKVGTCATKYNLDAYKLQLMLPKQKTPSPKQKTPSPKQKTPSPKKV